MARRQAPPEGHDPSRREFFRTFGRQTLQNAGAVAGAAAELRRTSLAAARELLEVNPLAAPDAPAGRVATSAEAARQLPDPTFRSAYRFTGDALVILDQRELPAHVETFEAHDASEVASAMRAGAITPGPVLAQVAAYAIVLAAASAVERSAAARDQVVKAATGTLRGARPEVHALAVAVGRMDARYDDLANHSTDGEAIRAGLAAEADAIALEATADHAAVGRSGADALAPVLGDATRPPVLQLLMHGDSGPLTCGIVGPGTAVLQLLREDGVALHVWVPACAPSGEGERITALQLAQIDIPHTVVADASVAWLLANRRLDAVLLRADSVFANGDATTLIGGLGVATLARSAGVRVLALAPSAAVDLENPDAARLVLDLRSAAEMGTVNQAHLRPPFDIVPGELIDALVTADGLSAPPSGEVG